MIALFQAVALLATTSSLKPAPPAPTPKPELLKRHGIVYGVRGLDYFPHCKGTDALDLCEVYALSGKVESVTYEVDTHRISAFLLRTSSGGRKVQHVDPLEFPLAAYKLIRPGRRVRVTGT